MHFRTTITVLGVILIVLAASLVGTFAYYSPLISGKNDTISSLNMLINEKNDALLSLNALVAQLSANITNLQNQLANLQNRLDSLNVTPIVRSDPETFSHYDTNSSDTPANNYTLGKLADWSETYTVIQGNYTIFHVTLTSYDPVGRVMWVYLPSAIYVIGSHSGTVKFDTYRLVNVTGDPTTGLQLNPAYAVNYTLLPETPMDVYFAGTGLDGGVIDPGNVYPLNLVIYGKLGTVDYGQNVTPFVQLYFR